MQGCSTAGNANARDAVAVEPGANVAGHSAKFHETPATCGLSSAAH